jgi:hypothetical protein
MSIFNKKQKLVDRKNLGNEQQQNKSDRLYNRGIQTGIGNTEINEPLPRIEFAPCEIQHQGKNNTYLILGRDRPAHRGSGLGGQGGTQCGRIDLCAGVASSYKRKDDSFGPDPSQLVNPNFITTASRVYITQRGNIDKYMGIASVRGFTNSKNRAAIGLKSDCIRLHARQDIKIVTGKSKHEGLGPSGERLSNGGEFDGVGTISFIAGNYTDDESSKSFSLWNPSNAVGGSKQKLQPLVKGKNLIEAFNDVVDILHEMTNRINENSKRTDTLANSYQNHFHDATPGFGGPSTPSMSTAMVGSTFTKIFSKIDRVHVKVNDEKLKAFKGNFLEEGSSNSYINSKYVFTT